MVWKSRPWRSGVVSSLVLFLAASGGSLGAAPPKENNLVYQIFVRSWADTPDDANAVGDLKGIREKLDYLNDGKPETDDDLEVGILWLLPVFPSPSYHGYDTTDYRDVNPGYGTKQDLDDLVRAAHERGVRVILDIAFNHTSDQHPWFKEAVDDPASRFRKFYHFADFDKPSPPGAWHVADGRNGRVRYFGLFSSTMPDLNLGNAETRQEVRDIAKFWLDRGLDGFRLDAAKHIFGDTFDQIPEPDILRNNDWWREFSDSVYRVKPDAVLVGEVLGDQEALRREAFGLDGLLDAPFMHAARARISFPFPGLLTGERDFVNRCRDVNRLAHKGPGAVPHDRPFQAFPFLASHDENPRLASFLEEQKAHGMRAEVDEAYRLGMYLLTSVGEYAILYYGDELMQRGFKWNGNPGNAFPPGDGSGLFDETLREPFPWHKAGDGAPQTHWNDLLPKFDRPNDGISVEEETAPTQMLNLVRSLTNLRTEHPGYANGEIGDVLTDSNDWLVFERVSDQDRYLVLINTTEQGNGYRFHEGWFPRYLGAQLIFRSDGQKKEWKDETKSNVHIDGKVDVPPYGMVLLRQKRN